MNFLTHKHIDRRTLLRGIGTAIALPALDAMFPALASSAKPPRRLAVVYVPNGIIMKDWKVATTGRDFAFTRVLKPAGAFPPGDHGALRTGQPCRRERSGRRARQGYRQLSLGCGAEVYRRPGCSCRGDVRPIGGAALGIGSPRLVPANRL